jgi:alginate O-acetyltransferase complex protein AlgI
MLFSSQVFIFYFLPLFALAYAAASGRMRINVLTVFSLVFYGWWNWKFLFLILISTVLDYVCGLGIFKSQAPRVRRAFLVASIVGNLSLLGFFKYFMFFSGSLEEFCAYWGLSYPVALASLQITLPIGISFYTFQTMSYTIDIYRGLAKPTRSFVDFACYVSMFPQLVAGPIVRYTHIERQLEHPRFGAERIYAGCQFFILGLSKKVLIADQVSVLADAVFGAADYAALSAWDVLAGVLAYSVQIYFDFSGYSDMAVGLGYFCGYEFPLNFDSPYKARSITEFWRRWHITLSTWLRDYLYIPLGGSRGGAWRTYRNLTITMLLGGLWHGASWHFVAWGGFHGLLLMGERALGGRNPVGKLPPVLQRAATFALVCLGWILFRAPDLPAALALMGRLAAPAYGSFGLLNVQNAPLGAVMLAAGMPVAFFAKNSWEIGTGPSWWKTALLLILFLLCLALLFGAVNHPFLYYQF